MRAEGLIVGIQTNIEGVQIGMSGETTGTVILAKFPDGQVCHHVEDVPTRLAQLVVNQLNGLDGTSRYRVGLTADDNINGKAGIWIKSGGKKNE